MKVYLGRALSDAGYTVQPNGLLLPNTVPVNPRAVVVGQVVVYSDSYFLSAFTGQNGEQKY